MTSRDLSAWRDWAKQLPSVDMLKWSRENNFSGDVVGQLVRGDLDSLEFHGNFLRCAFREAVVRAADFDRADFKDTSFSHCEFHDSALSDGSTVSCTFAECTFVRCKFTGAAVHDSLYRQCIFLECDFEHSMLRNSAVDDCKFDRCKTSNKLFEGCRIYENEFVETWLDFAAVIDNFGLDSRQLPIDWVRQNRSSPENRRFQADEKLEDAKWVSELNPFDRVKLEYYLSGGGLEGGSAPDAVFSLDSWLNLVRAPINLARLLQDLADFVGRRFQADQLDSGFVIKLAELSHTIWTGMSNEPEYGQLAQVAAAIYLECVRNLEEFDLLLRELEPTFTNNRIVFRSFDHASDDSITEAVSKLSVLVPDTDVQILPRNSPVDIVFSHMSYENLTFLLTLFFGTKTRLEIFRLVRNEGEKKPREETLFVASLGGAKEKTSIEAVRLEPTIPGLLKIRFDMRYSTSLVHTVKSVIESLKR